MSSLDSECEAFLICLGDMPSITSEEYNSLIDHYKDTLQKTDQPIVRPIYNDQVGHPVVFHHSYNADILDAPNESDCKLIIGQNIDHYYPIQIDSGNFVLDIDNEEEYSQYIKQNS